MYEKTGYPSEAAVVHAERIRGVIGELQGDVDAKIKRVLSAVFADELIKTEFANTNIRYTAMVGEVAQALLRCFNLPDERLGLMTIGDIDLPEFAQEVIDEIVAAAQLYERKFMKERGTGYDLAAKGMLSARKGVIDLFDKHYNFSASSGGRGAELIRKFADNMCLTAGGMCALDSVASTAIRLGLKDGKFNRFVSPHNSFSTWHSIVDERSAGGKTSCVHKLETKQENMLHLAADDIEDFYNRCDLEDEEQAFQTTWCITPVGNPSGTKMRPEQLKSVCEKIVELEPQAIIMLDCTYVRTLKPEKAQVLMRGVLENN